MSSHRPPYARCVWAWLVCFASLAGNAAAQFGHSFQETKAPASQPQEASPIRIEAQVGDVFTSEGEDVLLLRGHCRVSQGENVWTAPQIVLWQQSGTGDDRELIGYADGTPEEMARHIVRGKETQHPFEFFRLRGKVENLVRVVPTPESKDDPVVLRAIERRNNNRGLLQQTQYIVPPPPGSAVPPSPIPAIRRHVSINPRFLGERFEFKVEPSVGSVPQEFVATVTGGINIVIDNVPLNVGGRVYLTRLDLSADRAVIWSDADRFSDLGGFDLEENSPFQVYLEGNIVVRQGNNEVRSTHAFYDLNQRRGLSLNAEVRTYLPELNGVLRLRANELRQLSEMNYHAKDAWFTTSQFGQPKWRVESSDVFLQERPNSSFQSLNPFASPEDVDPTTLWISSLNNRFYVENTPVFATPGFSSPAEDPHVPIAGVSVGYSSMFGAELGTTWNVDGLFGLNLPQGLDWDLNLGYMTARGPSVGTSFQYDMDLGLPGLGMGHLTGESLIDYQYDSGRDRLGADRRSLDVPNNNRGRIESRTRFDLPYNTWITLESGHIFNNDRNYYEQFEEERWDEGKDLENLFSLNHRIENVQGSLLTQIRSNNFVDSSDWLPRFDLTMLGEPIPYTPVTWSQHSMVGYGHLHPATGPVDPVVDPFAPLPYFADSQGLVTMTRHELAMPFDVGPVHFVPYLMGEAAFWQEDLNQNSLARFYGSAGLRGSVQFSKYMPGVYDPILGLNGLAHKVVFDFDYSYSDSTRNLAGIPQYNEFDENSQERFRERYLAYQFGGGPLPNIYDPRFYAVRSGAGRSVTAPYHELVADQQVLWLGMHHRWQTKVGPPDRERIVDWMELDTGVAFFPDADRDNFGEHFGLLNGRYAWHVGPRTSFLANGVFDFFGGGQRVWNVGVLSQRSRRGSMFLGFRQVQAGPTNSQLVTGSYSYVMSPNLYVATMGASFDVAEGIDRGESLTLTRIGESWLLHFGLGYDRSKDNVGVALLFEPKFGSYGGGSMQLNSLLGIY
ncbi:MAG: LPS-assembly protein LptD [Planctomycetaceae bacterium]|nr:LPS-assembly protein LptD [Planctomycetaceae bacterium]MCB9952279.1 LPS-assembly protein LptD [Planctomycetaceae bacterium]